MFENEDEQSPGQRRLVEVPVESLQMKYSTPTHRFGSCLRPSGRRLLGESRKSVETRSLAREDLMQVG